MPSQTPITLKSMALGLPGSAEAAVTGLPPLVEEALDAVQGVEGCSGYATNASYGLIASVPDDPSD